MECYSVPITALTVEGTTESGATMIRVDGI